MSLVSLLFPLGLLACGPEPVPSGKEVVLVGGAGASEKAVGADGQPAAGEVHVENKASFDELAFTCCGAPSATAVVEAATTLGERLAKDDLAGTHAALDALVAAAATARDDAALPEAGRAAAATLAQATPHLQGKPLADVRKALASLNLAVADLARSSPGGSTRLVAAFCPMAPGYWLQRDAAIQNPYYGAQMLACGTLEGIQAVR
ncbi:hypothetical protein L6R53_10580 [Myxococcota bacterium]|nr:hypothetical protein [Myxococcota bacterium]